ncbi:MAG: hypothetical protein Q8O14_08210 [bacterium]|nr:hypothetical protein [bacterium]
MLSDFAPDRERQRLDVLFSMDCANPEHRRMMDLEGLKAWRPGRLSGFQALEKSARALDFFARRDAGESGGITP